VNSGTWRGGGVTFRASERRGREGRVKIRRGEGWFTAREADFVYLLETGVSYDRNHVDLAHDSSQICCLVPRSFITSLGVATKRINPSPKYLE